MWHQQGEAASPQTVDWQTAEITIHTWDLARATGQPTEVGQRALALMRASLKPEAPRVRAGISLEAAHHRPIG